MAFVNQIDPRLALAAKPLDVQNIFSNILTNVGEQQRQQQSAELQPFRSQLLQAQVQQNQQAVDQGRIVSVAQGAAEILPDLLQDNPQAAMQKLIIRKQRLTEQGRPTQDTDLAIEQLQTPEGQVQLTFDAENLVKNATQQGLLGRSSPSQKGQSRTIKRDGQLISQQEIFNPTSGTLEVIETPIDGDLVQKSTGLTSEGRVTQAGDKQQRTGDIKVQQDINKEAGVLGEQLKTKPLIAEAVETAKIEPAIKLEIKKANVSRMKELQTSEKTRNAATKKAGQFLRALKSGKAHSGATRSVASFVPGVFTSQAQFDERFNAFAEVAARQQLKAAGETRPTDADVEGMKRAMFGVGRDEETNIQLLEEFISAQNDQDDELETLKESRKSGTLDQFGAKLPQELTNEELFQ